MLEWNGQPKVSVSWAHSTQSTRSGWRKKHDPLNKQHPTLKAKWNCQKTKHTHTQHGPVQARALTRVKEKGRDGTDYRCLSSKLPSYVILCAVSDYRIHLIHFSVVCQDAFIDGITSAHRHRDRHTKHELDTHRSWSALAVLP